MHLIVNGSAFEAPETLTVLGLIGELQLGTKRFALELNGEIVPRSRHADVSLREGDRIEVVQAVGGG